MAAKKPVKRRKNKNNGVVRFCIFLLAVILLAVGVIFVVSSFGEEDQGSLFDPWDSEPLAQADAFLQNIYINDVHVGGMTMAQARDAVTAVLDAQHKTVQLNLVYGELTWQFTGADFAYASDLEAVLTQAFALGHSADNGQNREDAKALAQMPKYFAARVSYGANEVTPLVQKVAAAIDVSACDADIIAFSRADGPLFSREIYGAQVDQGGLSSLLVSALASGSTGTAIQVPVNSIAPDLTREVLAASFTKLASFQSVATSNSARNNNIKLALGAMDGAIVRAGETFSMNTATGERTADKGYRPAGAIRNGEFVEELGGGVCQVSTALFNAVARSGLEITERKNHTYPSTYIDIGLDAMVDYPASDFIFTNNSAGAVCLSMWFDGDSRTIHVEVYGMPILEEGVTLDLASEVTETITLEDVVKEDPNLPLGTVEQTTTGRTGYRSNTYLVYYKNGSETGRELLCTSSYRAVAAVYSVGTGAPLELPPEGEPTPEAEAPAE